MSRYRFFSLVAFAAMAVVSSLSFATSAALDADYRDFAYQVVDHTERILVSLPDITYDKPAYMAEVVEAPRLGADVLAVLYDSHNQPGQTWRFGVDAYRHIDPGRLFV
jgi:hypothetical protein